MTNDVIGLLVSYVYAGALLIIGEVLHRYAHIPNDITRKSVNIGAGMWMFGVLSLFGSWQIGVIPFASFIGLNYFFYRAKIFRGIDSDTASLGTVYFAISITLLSIALWRPAGPIDHAPALVAGVMTMTWGDALAALIGKHYGTHRYTINGGTRSYEGSAVMFVVSLIVIFLALRRHPQHHGSRHRQLRWRRSRNRGRSTVATRHRQPDRAHLCHLGGTHRRLAASDYWPPPI